MPPLAAADYLSDIPRVSRQVSANATEVASDIGDSMNIFTIHGSPRIHGFEQGGEVRIDASSGVRKRGACFGVLAFKMVCFECRRGQHFFCMDHRCVCGMVEDFMPLPGPTVGHVGEDSERAIELNQGVFAAARAGETVDGAVVLPPAFAASDGVNRVAEGLCFHE